MGDYASNQGIYSFTLDNGPPEKARFTFVYKKKDNTLPWGPTNYLIIQHHSSKEPCNPPTPVAPSGLSDCPGGCPGDVNGDSQVDIVDFNLVLGAWGACSPEP